MEIYNRLSSDIWAMNIPLAAKVIAERICALTKNGEKECFISNSYLVNLLRLSESTVQRSLSLLQETKIISIKVVTKNDKKVRLVCFIYQENDCIQKDKSTEKQSKNHNTEQTYDTTILNNPNCQNASMQTVKMKVSSIQSNDLGVRRESNDLKNTHSPSSDSFVFSVQKAEEILLSVAKEMNISLGFEKIHSEALKFFDYYSEKKLSIGQLKVKARTWIDNCKKYPDYKNKKHQSHSTAADGGFLGILEEECEKEKELKQSGVITGGAVNDEFVFPNFPNLSEKENGYSMLLEYPIDHH